MKADEDSGQHCILLQSLPGHNDYKPLNLWNGPNIYIISCKT